MEQLTYEYKKKYAELIGNRRFVGCVYAARTNWRSKVEIELLGI